MKNKFKKPEETIDFIGIGAAKSASTWLNKCLEEHPDILTSSQKTRKEINFFNSGIGIPISSGRSASFYHKGYEWYLKQFPPAQKGKIRGEFCVTYLIDNEAPKRIKKFNPNIKILAILRNPSEMINSLHWQTKTRVKYHISDDINKQLDKGFYIEAAQYHKNLKRYFDLFPHKNIKVVILDEVKENPRRTLQEVYKFLNVDKDFIPTTIGKKINKAFVIKNAYIKNLLAFVLKILKLFKMKNLHRYLRTSKFTNKIYHIFNTEKKSHDKLDEKTKQRIKEILRNDIENLEKLLDKDLNVWK